MKGLFRILCWVLVLLWVPVTVHCDLEFLGLSEEHCDSGDCSAGEACAEDLCAQVEDGAYRPVDHDLRVFAPEMMACSCLLCVEQVLSRLETIVETPPPAWETPRDWVVAWQFTRRAAPSPRAPSCAA